MRLLIFLLVFLALRRKRTPPDDFLEPGTWRIFAKRGDTKPLATVTFTDDPWSETEWATVWKR